MEGGATGPHARRPRGGDSDGAYAGVPAAIKLVSPPRPRLATWISCGEGATAVHPCDVTVDERSEGSAGSGKRPRGWDPRGREGAASPHHRATLSEPLPRSSTTAARRGGCLSSWASEDAAEGARPPLHTHTEPATSREPLALLTLRLRADAGAAEGEGRLDADLRACIAAVHDAWASPETGSSLSSVPGLPAFLRALEARLRGAVEGGTREREGAGGRRRDDHPSNCYSVVSDEEERLSLGVSALGSEADTTRGSLQDSVLSHATTTWFGPAAGPPFTPGRIGRASVTAFGSPGSVSRPPIASPAGLALRGAASASHDVTPPGYTASPASPASLASGSALSSPGARRGVGALARQASSAASYDGFEEYAAELDREATPVQALLPSSRRAGMQSCRSAMSGRELDSLMRVELVARPGGSPPADRDGGEGEAQAAARSARSLPGGDSVHVHVHGHGEGTPPPAVGVPKLSFVLEKRGGGETTLPASPGPGTVSEGVEGGADTSPPSRAPFARRRPLSLSMSFSFQEDFVSEVTRQAKDEEVRTRRASGMQDSSSTASAARSTLAFPLPLTGRGDGIAQDVEAAFGAALTGSAGALTSSAARAMVAELAEMPTHGRAIPKYPWARQSTVSEESEGRGPQ